MSRALLHVHQRCARKQTVLVKREKGAQSTLWTLRRASFVLFSFRGVSLRAPPKVRKFTSDLVDRLESRCIVEFWIDGRSDKSVTELAADTMEILSGKFDDKHGRAYADTLCGREISRPFLSNEASSTSSLLIVVRNKFVDHHG